MLLGLACQIATLYNNTSTLSNMFTRYQTHICGYLHNKRPMGHVAHLRKQFKSLNKYDYIITLIQRKKKKLYENLLVFHLNKLEFPSPRCFVPRLVEIGPVVLEKILKFRKCVFSRFRNYLPVEKGGVLYLNKLEYPSPKDSLCQVQLKLAQWFWVR